MTMTGGLRKFALTVHVITSVGWLGTVAAFLALAIAGLTSQDEQTVQSAYPAMQLLTSLVIVPLCFASLLTGLVESLATEWGLLRHYWIVIKLVITLLSTLLLLVHTQPIGYMAGVTAETTLSVADFREVRLQLVVDAGAALLVLLIVTALSVYKPRGMTRYGWRKQYGQRTVS